MFQSTAKKFLTKSITSKTSIQPLRTFSQRPKSRPHTQHFQSKRLTNTHFKSKPSPIKIPVRTFYHISQIPSQEKKKEDEKTKEKRTMFWGWMAVTAYIGHNTVVIMREQKEEFEAELASKDVIIKELEEKLKKCEEREGQGEVRLSFEDGPLGLEKVPMICNF